MSSQLEISQNPTAALDEHSFIDAGQTLVCREAEGSRIQEVYRSGEVEPRPGGLAQDEGTGSNHDVTPKRCEADVIRRESGIGQSDTSLALYLRDIGRVKPLTRQQEIELSALVQRGNPEARDQMIKANLALVIKIARGYEGLGVPFLDLISEGNIGLLKAVERFDPSKGAKFSGYGALWIKHAITRALASQAKAVRLPMHVVEKLGKIRRAAWRLREVFGREASDEELAAAVGITPLQVSEMRMASSHPASLDTVLDDEDSRSYADIIADERVQMPDEKLEDEARMATLRESFNALNTREKSVLRSRFGLNGEQSKTLEKVGQKLSMTAERVRQIQNTALKKLRRRMKNLEMNGSHSGAIGCGTVGATAAQRRRR